MMGGFGWLGMGGFGMLIGAVVWIAVIVLLVWGAGSLLSQRNTDSEARADALEILKHRYAAGEITSAEFETARKALAA